MKKLLFVIIMYSSTSVMALDIPNEVIQKAYEVCRVNGGLEKISVNSVNTVKKRVTVYCVNGMYTEWELHNG